MNRKEYKVADGRTAVFEYDENGIGKITLECMDVLMGMIPQWIPVSERLPSAEHNLEGFLVTSKLPNYLEDDVDVFFEVYYNGQFGSHWDGEQLGHVDDGVIAWMECPSPYKGES